MTTLTILAAWCIAGLAVAFVDAVRWAKLDDSSQCPEMPAVLFVASGPAVWLAAVIDYAVEDWRNYRIEQEWRHR